MLKRVSSSNPINFPEFMGILLGTLIVVLLGPKIGAILMVHYWITVGASTLLTGIYFGTRKILLSNTAHKNRSLLVARRINMICLSVGFALGLQVLFAAL